MKVLILTLSLIASSALAETWTLTESSLKSELQNSNPDLLKIEEGLSRAQYADQALREKYQLNWVSEAKYQDSSEKAFAAFIPTFGPTYDFSTGFEKQFQSGLSLNGAVFANQQSTADGSIDEATRSGLKFGFSMDLWKNFLGRVNRSELNDSQYQLQKQKIQSDINSYVVELEMRKLYWSIVANHEKLRISNELLKTSKAQLIDGIKRQKKHIADKAEVARYQSQVASRQATIESLSFQRDLLIQSLKEQLPDLTDREIALGPYNISQKVGEVLVCAEDLKAQKKTPWQNTKWDEILELVDKSYNQRKVINDRYSDIDLQLTSNLQVSGVDKGYSNSFDDFSSSGEAGYDVGLKLTIPIGSTQSKAKAARANADHKLFLSEKRRLLAQAEARHTQIVSLVGILQASIVSLNENSQHLETSIRENQKKFQQARISLNNLISEQDALLNSRLSEIDTKLTAIHTLLDYFQTFTEDPCSLNRLAAQGA